MTYAKRISFQDQEYLKNLRAHELARQHGKARAGKNPGSARLMARLGS